MSITVSAFGSVCTILYRNRSTNQTQVWVCENKQTALTAKKHLRTMSHIEIIDVTDSHLVTEQQAGEWRLQMQAERVDKLRVRFCCYGDSRVNRRLDDLAEMKRKGSSFIARVEHSGSESVYVEVACYCPTRKQYLRYCFEKMMDTGWQEAGFESEEEAAAAVAERINGDANAIDLDCMLIDEVHALADFFG